MDERLSGPAKLQSWALGHSWVPSLVALMGIMSVQTVESLKFVYLARLWCWGSSVQQQS